jgi:hypothetical protein
LTLAVRYNSGSPENSIKLRLSQRKLNDVSYQQYVFKTTESTSVIPQSESNKDISGKFLRFNNAAILENRVSVVVNGVQKIVGTDANEISLAPNTVNFNSAIPAGSTVSVIIYSEQVTTQNDLVFERNDVLNNTGSSYGSWANIKRIDCADSIGDWYLYSCTFLSSLSYSVKIKVESVLDTSGNILKIGDELSDIRFMLATAPYRHVDRYYNFIVSGDNLNSYSLSTSSSGFLQLYVDSSLVTEVYPPIEIKNNRLVAPGIYASDYIVNDDYTNSAGTSLILTGLTSKKIIGPI